jgi:DNA repair protein RecO (recombination protein O)
MYLTNLGIFFIQGQGELLILLDTKSILGNLRLLGHHRGVLEKSQGIVIRIIKLTETSSIVRWWTMQHGLVETVAKGARRPSSPFAGKIDLFFSADLSWQRAQKGNLHHLRESSVIHYREGLRKRYVNTLMAGYFCGLIEKITEIEHPEPEIYDLLHRGLDHIAEVGANRKAMRFFERELARLHGVGKESGDVIVALADLGTGLPAMRKELLERLENE